jgi:spore germination protein GerM
LRSPTTQSFTKYLILAVVLLVVPLALSSCRSKHTLSDKDKKKVEGQVVVPASGAAAGDKAAAPQIAVAGINTATIWFIKSDGDKLTYVSENREHEGAFKNPVDALTFAITELLAGPKGPLQSQGASSEIPPGTVLIGVTEGKATPDIVIDMSQRFSQGAGPDSFESRIEQIKRTAVAVAPGRNIFLNVEGQRLTATGEGLEVPQPICGPAAGTASAAAGEGAGGEASSSSASSKTLQLAH